MEVRETIMKYGAVCVSDEDLLSIIIDDESKTRQLLKSYASDINTNQCVAQNIMGESFEQLKYRGKLTPKQTLRLTACIELAKRLGSKPKEEKINATMPEEVCNLLMPRYRFERQEYFLVVCLNSKNKIIKIKDLFKGGLNGSVVDSRTIFNEAIIEHASAIILAHNHPSGDPRPSNEDKVLTKKMVESGKILSVPVLDHIILGDNCYFSFQEDGLME